MTFDILLVALAALVLSNVVLLVAAARSGVVDVHVRSNTSSTSEAPVRYRAPGTERSVATHRETSAVPAMPRMRGQAVPGAAATLPATPAPAPTPEPTTAPEPNVAPEPTAAPDEVERLIHDAPIAAAAEPAAPDLAPIGQLMESGHDEVKVQRNGARVAPSAVDGSSAAALDRPETTQPPKGGARASGRRAATNGKRGRRFTLPSIEVDHERTERVVLSLLSGDDEPGGGQLVDAWQRLVGGESDGPAGRSAVVVALALDGLDAYAESGGRDAAERLVGGVLDAIRRSARGSDRVASVGRGRFRVLLVDADGEVASRFVSRVRELADRRISLSAAPVRVAAGWAEATSAGGLDAAVRAAEDQRRRNLAVGSAAKRDVSPA